MLIIDTPHWVREQKWTWCLILCDMQYVFGVYWINQRFTLVQRFPTWGTCTPYGYTCLSERVLLRLEKCIFIYISFIAKCLYIYQWIFFSKIIYDYFKKYLWLSMMKYFVIRKFRGTYSSVGMLKGYMAKKRLGIPALVCAKKFLCSTIISCSLKLFITFLGTTWAIFCGLRKVNVIVQEVGYVVDNKEITKGHSGIELCMCK